LLPWNPGDTIRTTVTDQFGTGVSYYTVIGVQRRNPDNWPRRFWGAYRSVRESYGLDGELLERRCENLVETYGPERELLERRDREGNLLTGPRECIPAEDMPARLVEVTPGSYAWE